MPMNGVPDPVRSLHRRRRGAAPLLDLLRLADGLRRVGYHLSGTHDSRHCDQGCQMAKFDPFLSLDCARVEGVGAQSKERKGSNFAA